jgi:predicted dehydrogenase
VTGLETKTLRVGLIGSGFMGRHHANCWQAVEGARLVAVADPDKTGRDKCPGNPNPYDNWPAMLAAEELDIVDVCTPTPWHVDASIAGLEKGCHVLCEKPMALSLAECDRLVAASRSARGMLMIAHVIRFWPEYAWLKQAKDSGRYGPLRTFTGLRRMPWPMYNWDMWTHDEKRAGGIPFEGNIHDVDYLRYLMGEPQEVHAVGVRDHTGIGQIWGSFSFADGSRAILEGSWGYPAAYPFQHGYVAVFEEATVDYRLDREKQLLVYAKDAKEPEEIVLAQPTGEKSDAGGNISDLGGYLTEIEYFVDCVRKGTPPTVTTPSDARESVRLLEAEIESVASGRVVTL